MISVCGSDSLDRDGRLNLKVAKISGKVAPDESTGLKVKTGKDLTAMASSTRERHSQISISGTLGSGKSTVGRALAEILGWRFISTGSVQRDISQSMGLSTLELNKIAETDRSIDERVDRVFQTLANEENIVVDSRMAWYFLPNSFRVRLLLSPDLAAARIMKDANRSAEKYADPAVAVADIAARAGSERQRFLNTYGVDITNSENYHLVVDTAGLPPDAVTQRVRSAYSAWNQR